MKTRSTAWTPAQYSLNAFSADGFVLRFLVKRLRFLTLCKIPRRLDFEK